MIRLLQWLIFGHVHKWKQVDRTALKMTDSDEVGTRVECVCERCGVHRKFDLI